MREIKFRAWHPDKQSMEYFDFIRTPDVNEFGKADWFLQDLMQYTGLLDKNGKEIYEGDIVFDEDGEFSKTCRIEWHNENAQFVGVDINGLGGFQMEEIDGEIIGNIYENPNLLTLTNSNESK